MRSSAFRSALSRTFVNLMVWIVLYGSLLSYIIGICDSAQPFIQGTIFEQRVWAQVQCMNSWGFQPTCEKRPKALTLLEFSRMGPCRRSLPNCPPTLPFSRIQDLTPHCITGCAEMFPDSPVPPCRQFVKVQLC